MKNYVLTFLLALLVVLTGMTLRRTVVGIGGTPVPPYPPSLAIGGTPVPPYPPATARTARAR